MRCLQPYKRIIYTSHALVRIDMRYYSKNAVEDTVRNPDSLSDARDGARKATKKTNNGIISVIYKEEDNELLIITVYPGE